jgi:beta-fructofuranosidase
VTPVLRLDDEWIWDSWIADDGERYHLFYLSAPTALGDAGLRHEHARIGHAVSADLVDWTVLPPALSRADTGWDDLALWTGSTVRGDDGVWRLFYTAISTRGHRLRDQRIGIAESRDLLTWTRVGDAPALEPDATRYKTLDEDPSSSETWRDPFVFRLDDGWHMLVTARAPDRPRKADGVLAHATSPDQLHWSVQDPLGVPGGFGQLEVPQVRRVDGAWVLVFTCHPQEQTDEQVARFGPHSTWSLTAPSPLGPWEVERAKPFTDEPALFAAPLVQRRDGSWALLGFRNLEPEGILAFEILDPIPVRLAGDHLEAAR